MNKLYFFLLSTFIISCENEVMPYEEISRYTEGEEFLVPIELSTSAINSDSFGRSIDGFDRAQNILFFNGNRLFNTAWVSAPSVTTGLDGLGPTFNAKACDNCHFKDGRGKPLFSGAANSLGFLMRISIPGSNEHGGPLDVPGYGDQLQTNSILNIASEGKVTVIYETITGSYEDGTAYTLRKPMYSLEGGTFGSLDNVLTSPRIGNQLIGLGLIDATPTSEILKNEDINDLDKDGISGKANYVWDVQKERLNIGKFGWKANQPNLRQQVAGALSGDIGLTTSIFRATNCPSPQNDCYNAPNGENDNLPEVTETALDRLTFYQSALAVPLRRNFKEKAVLDGKELFTSLNCITCHQTNLKTGTYSFNTHLENVVYHPYSDFLLHDMGEDLADKRPEFLATGNEWRTQPLWGIGLISVVNDHTFLLHDGRARSIEEAILWHGGEAEKSKLDFKKLTETERSALLSFIDSL
jgi:CxxC motif-containing protein (DUF1111 family)